MHRKRTISAAFGQGLRASPPKTKLATEGTGAGPQMVPSNGAKVAAFAFGLAALVAGCAFGPQAKTTGTVDDGLPHAFLYAGTNAGAIEIFEIDAATGSLIVRGKVGAGGTVAALAGLPFGRTLAALDDGTATVITFDVEAGKGALHQTGRAATGGSRPGRIALDHSGKFVLVTHQASASVGVLAVKPAGGLATADLFPAGAGAYGIGFHPSNQVLFVANTKAGTLSQFSFSEGTGGLTPKPGAAVGLPWGSGPRGVVSHPSGHFIYVLNESNSTVSVHSFDERMGTVTRLAFQVISTLPTETGNKGRAVEIAVAVSGRFLYVINRGDDSIVTFAVDGETGSLTLVNRTPSGGAGAQALALDPGGRFLVAAHQTSHHLSTFSLDPKTGVPTLGDNKKIGAAPLSAVIMRPR